MWRYPSPRPKKTFSLYGHSLFTISLNAPPSSALWNLNSSAQHTTPLNEKWEEIIQIEGYKHIGLNLGTVLGQVTHWKQVVGQGRWDDGKCCAVKEGDRSFVPHLAQNHSHSCTWLRTSAGRHDTEAQSLDWLGFQSQPWLHLLQLFYVNP